MSLRLLTFDYSFSESSLTCAVDTNRAQFVHLFSKRDQVNDVAERLPLKSAIQSSHQHYFAQIGRLLTELHNVLEELSLINTHHIVVLHLGDQRHKFGHLSSFFRNSE